MTHPLSTDPPLAWARYYLSLGWGLCHFERGTKGPRTEGWNTPEKWVNTPERADAVWAAQPSRGMGLVHAASGTCAIDVDDLAHAERIFAEFGLDLLALLAPGLRIRGALANRAKAIFRAPDGVALATHKIGWRRSDGNGTQALGVLELRAGTVQDVLPPSIHPDGHAYEWLRAPWEVDEIPALPADLLAFWTEYAILRPEIDALAPWELADAPYVPPPLPRAPSPHDDVIGQFNRARALPELLERYGYVRKGKRFLAPTSTTRIPGVVILGDRVYSHHGNDVLADGHAHDAFDLYCRFEHGGEVPEAVKAAARELGIPTPTPPISPDVKAFAASVAAGQTAGVLAFPRKPDPAEIPADLLRPPGVLATIADYTLAASVRPIPVFAAQAAIALGSVVCARRYVTSAGNFSSLYLMNVAKSGTGKEAAKKAIETILSAANARKLVAGSSYSSGSAVYSALLRKPQHVAIVDEFGKYMEAAAAPGTPHLSQALTMLMQSFGRVDSDMSTPEFSTLHMRKGDAPEPAIIQRPAITLLALTTPSSFYNAITSVRMVDGFLNRFLVAEYTGPRVPMGEWGSPDVPQLVLDWITTILAPRGDLDELGRVSEVPAPRVVPITPDALIAARAFERDMLRLADESERSGLGDMPVRTTEIGMRLALIAALADTPDTPVVTTDVLDWALRYARFFLMQTLAALEHRVSDSPTERRRNEFLAAIVGARELGVTEKEFNSRKPFTAVDRKQRYDYLRDLQGAGKVSEFIVVHTGKRGRPRKAIIALADVDEEDAA